MGISIVFHRYLLVLFVISFGVLKSDKLLAKEIKLPNINVFGDFYRNGSFSDGTSLENISNYLYRTNDTAQLLEDLPGVSLYGAGGVSSLPSIHGLADDRIRIKIDGMDLISSCANHMNPPLSFIDPANVSSIKIFSGVTPVSVGGDSIAGTIKVESATPEFAEVGKGLILKGRVGNFYRSNNDARGINFSTTTAVENFSARYTGSLVVADNYQAGSSFKSAGLAARDRGWLSGDEVGSSKYRSENHMIAFGLKQENHLLEFKVGYQNIPYQGFVNQRMDMTLNESTQLNLSYKGAYEWGLLEARIYKEHTRHQMNFGDDKLYMYGSGSHGAAPYNVAGMPMNTLGKNLGAVLKADIKLSDNDIFKIGAEYQRYRLDDWWPPVANSSMMGPSTFLNINNGQRDRYDIFAEWNKNLNKEWLSSLGVRYSQIEMNTGNVNGYMLGYTGGGMGMPMTSDDANSPAFNALNKKKSDHNIDASAILSYTPDVTRAFDFGYSLKTRSPNLYERYTWNYNSTMDMNMNNWYGDGNGYVGNINLKPEKAHTFGVAGKWNDVNKEYYSIRVAPYISYVEDYIDAAECSSAIGVSCASRTADGFKNLSLVNKTARIYGLDLSGQLNLGRTENLGHFNLSGVFNYTRGRNIDTHDNLYNIMPPNLKLAFQQQVGQWRNTFEGKFVDEKDDVQSVRKELRTAGYAVFNLYSSYQWNKVRFDGGVYNLFDKFYNNPLGGAYLGQGATMGTAVAYGTAVPGMGRSINFGLTIDF
jgi:iron complex outermembrane receptor protein